MQWLWQRLVGWHPSPAQRMHRLFLFTGASVLMLSALANGFLQITSVRYAIALGVIACVAFGLWWQALRGANSQRMARYLCMLVTLVALPINWFANQGIAGPSLILYLLMATYMLSAIRVSPRQRLLAAAGFVLMPVLLIAVEWHFPASISRYASHRDQIVDLSIAYCFCVVTLFVLMGGHYQRLLLEKRRVRQFAARMREQARRDSLTGLLNHGAFHDLLDRRLKRPRPEAGAVALVLYDLDHFKRINDTHGHPYGDDVLRQFVALLREVAGDQDIALGRYGGEEFCVLLCGDSMCVDTFDRLLRQRALASPVAHGVIAFSGGSVESCVSDHTASLFERADRALYRAKREGRNRLIKGERITTLPAGNAGGHPPHPSGAVSAHPRCESGR